ncbi:MAG: hypothetical protein US60_C0007G0017 [Microgenomates group bacterium GW2011_GWC1_37_8]|uniref:Secondary thiamine-phosphate synthase enzyme n=1 Tax=Candidatus Woesebacteria bacterium GW2011_GWB1_38_8 TaxID=1618570 RepID=A0A0G0L2N9_9BACT|nr:MAG: hypothetical protein US60_C0007G0017 [Microgenomates group bacterium GW2011_GWC1_37_8]KKQ85272.1 MAG: hypothetical protein UT08_C0008G0028 [Candidatus Woesebacteria bacterium GW2011_GWB1_38_8]
MKVYLYNSVQKLTIPTLQNKQIIDLTKIINDLLVKNGYTDGIVFLFCTHTTCSLALADLDTGGTDEDYLNAYEALVPKLNYKHPHNPGHFGNHLMTTTLGSSLFIPVQSASMVLGAWQKVALIEFDGPSERHVTLSFIKITS